MFVKKPGESGSKIREGKRKNQNTNRKGCIFHKMTVDGIAKTKKAEQYGNVPQGVKAKEAKNNGGIDGK